MINIERTYSYCKDDISLIENYDIAKNDETQTWVCHHRDEIRKLSNNIVVLRSVDDLIEAGRYYNCPANELIFLTIAEHAKLHADNRKPCSEETKQKISNSLKGKLTGRTFSEETRKKLSEARKGRIITEETKEKLRKANTGKKYGQCSVERKEKIRNALVGRHLIYIDGRKHYVKENHN